jgi:hypothetical protein
MIAIGIILSFVSLGFLCWLLFALAVHALPVLVAVTAGVAAYDSGAGEIGAFLVGLIAGALTLAAGQIAVAAFRLPLVAPLSHSCSPCRPPCRPPWRVITQPLVSRSSAYLQSCGSERLR